jgi:hypothetical protein
LFQVRAPSIKPATVNPKAASARILGGAGFDPSAKICTIPPMNPAVDARSRNRFSAP